MRAHRVDQLRRSLTAAKLAIVGAAKVSTAGAAKLTM